MRSFGRCSSLFVLIALLMWLGGCRGLTGASLDPETARQLQGKVNHIIFMVQENRSFDHYLGQLGQYREANGYGKASDIDGMPATASNPNLDGTADLKTFHLKTTCVEEVSGSWLE
ncbi:MAG TPA: alkaline phosphatase family protein, partial [Terriglobales bacterium]|nr:alkaline phosphatase family protein [Terriglobales bacterium]